MYSLGSANWALYCALACRWRSRSRDRSPTSPLQPHQIAINQTGQPSRVFSDENANFTLLTRQRHVLRLKRDSFIQSRRSYGKLNSYERLFSESRSSVACWRKRKREREPSNEVSRGERDAPLLQGTPVCFPLSSMLPLGVARPVFFSRCAPLSNQCTVRSHLGRSKQTLHFSIRSNNLVRHLEVNASSVKTWSTR